MITIPKVYTEMENGEQGCSPARELTPEEKAGVIAIWGDDENYFYFEHTDEQHPKYLELINLQNGSQS